MKNLSIEHGLRLLMTGLLLVATTLATPIVVHCRACCGWSHEHQPGQYGLSECAQRDACQVVTVHHHDAHCNVATTGQLHRHNHLVILGSAVPLAGSEDSDDSRRGLPADRELLFVASFRGASPGAAGGSSHPQSWLTQAVIHHVAVVVAVEQRLPAPTVAPPPFLCDRARHERSGVQLA